MKAQKAITVKTGSELRKGNRNVAPTAIIFIQENYRKAYKILEVLEPTMFKSYSLRQRKTVMTRTWKGFAVLYPFAS